MNEAKNLERYLPLNKRKRTVQNTKYIMDHLSPESSEILRCARTFHSSFIKQEMEYSFYYGWISFSMNDESLDTMHCPRSLFDRILEELCEENNYILLDAFLSRAIKDQDIGLFQRIYHTHTAFIEYIQDLNTFSRFAKLLLDIQSNDIIKHMILFKEDFPHDFLSIPNLLEMICEESNAEMFTYALDSGIEFDNFRLPKPRKYSNETNLIFHEIFDRCRVDLLVDKIGMIIQYDNSEILSKILETEATVYKKNWMTIAVIYDSIKVFVYLTEYWDDFADRDDKDHLLVHYLREPYNKIVKHVISTYIIPQIWFPESDSWKLLLNHYNQELIDFYVQHNVLEMGDDAVDNYIMCLTTILRNTWRMFISSFNPAHNHDPVSNNTRYLIKYIQDRIVTLTYSHDYKSIVLRELSKNHDQSISDHIEPLNCEQVYDTKNLVIRTMRYAIENRIYFLIYNIVLLEEKIYVEDVARSIIKTCKDKPRHIPTVVRFINEFHDSIFEDVDDWYALYATLIDPSSETGSHSESFRKPASY